jgi:DNA-directed RNA polymerase specialized sigma24 family protein
MRALLPRDRRFLQLYFFEGHSISQAAKILNISNHVAYCVKHRAINRLKAAIGTRQSAMGPDVPCAAGASSRPKKPCPQIN